jgi:hypothetical protein
LTALSRQNLGLVSPERAASSISRRRARTTLA